MVATAQTRDWTEDGGGRVTEFAAVDVETTGLFAHRHDRVIEVGIVVCDPSGVPRERYATLVNPGRDLGPTQIHGIRGRDVADAPTFPEIIGDISERLRGRVLVAHNARFDRDFLASEYERAGYAFPRAPWVCSMALASKATGARSLSACCDSLALDGSPSHSTGHPLTVQVTTPGPLRSFSMPA